MKIRLIVKKCKKPVDVNHILKKIVYKMGYCVSDKIETLISYLVREC